jgi:hypothetical protein
MQTQLQSVQHCQSEENPRVTLNLYILKVTNLQAAETIFGGINKMLGASFQSGHNNVKGLTYLLSYKR